MEDAYKSINERNLGEKKYKVLIMFGDMFADVIGNKKTYH